jgi:hypothetical protein
MVKVFSTSTSLVNSCLFFYYAVIWISTLSECLKIFLPYKGLVKTSFFGILGKGYLQKNFDR